MMKKHLVIPLLFVAAAALSCRETPVGPRPTIPMVYAVLADSTGAGRLAAQSGRRGGEGSIAIIGEPKNTIVLARRLQGTDRVDNVDGRPVRDSLPDFAGETFDVIMDAVGAPYAQFLTLDRNLSDSLRQESLDSLRERAVINAVSAWDSLSWRSATDTEPLLRKQRAKMLIYTSTLQAQWGLFDVDTLQQLCGGGCIILSPVHAMLDQAYASGARSLVVWTTRDVRASGAWQSVFARKGWADAHLTVIAPERALDIRTELRSVLREYQATGRVMDALLVDDVTVNLAPLQSELSLIGLKGTDEDAAFHAMMAPGFALWNPVDALIRATYENLREHSLFTHRIARPALHYYETAESAEGMPLLVETSAAYAQSTYVSDLY